MSAWIAKEKLAELRLRLLAKDGGLDKQRISRRYYPGAKCLPFCSRKNCNEVLDTLGFGRYHLLRPMMEGDLVPEDDQVDPLWGNAPKNCA